MRIVGDIESDGLLDTITKIHCLCYYDYDTGESKSLTSYKDIINLFNQDDLTFICHNNIRFDIPAIEKILGIKVKARLIDTLALSWYLFPDRLKHGLEYWGVDLGIIKPHIGDWSGDTEESLDAIINRCQEDVKINTELFNLQINKLLKIYSNGNLDRFLDYISFKMDCAREQEEVRWKLDKEKCEKVLSKLLTDRDIKIEALTKAMPENIKYGIATKPNKTHIKDGSISAQGEKWFYLLGQKGLPLGYEEPIQIEILREPGNPNSVPQIKKWLFDLGWVPQEFKYVKEPDPNNPERTINRPVPQINTQDDGICPSVKLLYEKEPKLENLESLGIINHRISILEGFLENVSEDGYLQAQISGLTNTLRFQHKVLVNIPTIFKPYGEDIRGCLIAPEGMILCGSDLSGAEESTKHHYMTYYDPKYVEEMRQPGFDPHLDIALEAKMLTQQQVEDHKSGKQKFPKIRWNAKRTNFACTYGSGISKLMLTSGMDNPTATILHRAYWKRNWAIKKIAKDAHWKEVDGQMWLYNPVSQFWYSLRFVKDIFSTLNQGTAVFCFDTWVRNVRKRGIKICGQFHDEIAFPLFPEEKELRERQLQDSIEEANEQLGLNVKLSISVDVGLNYAQIH